METKKTQVKKPVNVAKKPVGKQAPVAPKKPAVVKAPVKAEVAKKTPSVTQKIQQKVAVAKALKLPVVDKVQVVKVMDVGHTKTQFHCKMANGTMVHVDKSKFASQNINELNGVK